MRNRIVAAFVIALVMTIGATTLPLAPAQAADPPGPPALRFALWLGEKAAGAAAAKGFNFVFSQIGLNSLFPEESPELAEIKKLQGQMDGLSRQLANVQRSLDALTRDVRENGLDVQLIALRGETNRVRDLFDTSFSPLVDTAAKIADAKEKGEPADEIADLEEDLLAKRDSFYARYDSYPYGAIPGTIHEFLVPGEGNSVLGAKGKVILATKRYLNSEDSKVLRQLYDGLADQQAVAASMRMERYLPSIKPLPPRPTAPGDIDIFNKVRKQWLADRTEEHVSLPRMIPNDVVIDAGPLPRSTTNNARWFMPASRDRLRLVPGDALPGSVQAVNTFLNTRSVAGASDWGVVSNGALEGLLPNLGVGTSVGRDLSYLNPTNDLWNNITQWPFIWGATPGTAACTPAQSGVNLGLTVNKSSFEWKPRCASEGPGGFIASRIGGPQSVDFMGQGSGPNIKPFADLRSVDLSGLSLAGVDMHGADLTNARLVGTDLTDAKLADAKFAGVSAWNIVGKPASLPTGLDLIDGFLIGPNVNLRGADLRDVNLNRSVLTGVTSGGTTCSGCTLPPRWSLTSMPSGFLLGPGADLVGADLRGVNMAGADLEGANLTEANLTGANVTGANLRNANLTGAILDRATLDTSDLSGSTATVASFRSASMIGVSFGSADLTGAVMSGADLTNTFFLLTKINSVDFDGAKATGLYSSRTTGTPKTLPSTDWRLVTGGYLVGAGANLQFADLRGLNFSNAKLAGTNFANANLTSVNFTSADLTGSSFYGANLFMAVLTNAILARSILTSADVQSANFATNDDNKLDGIVSGDMKGTATMPVSGRYTMTQGYFVGPSANLANATFTSAARLGISLSSTNFTNATLNGVNLSGAFLNNANLTSAKLTNVNLTGVNMTNATLTGIESSGITGVPGLPSGWGIVNGSLVAPLGDVDGDGALSSVSLVGDKNGRLVGDVDPDLGNASWTVTIEQEMADDAWVVVGTYVTTGGKETFVVNLPAGNYRVSIPDQLGYRESRPSDEVVLLK